MGMLAYVTHAPNSDEQRRTPRRAIRLEVESGAVAATVRNLSENGLLIESPESLDVGDRVSLDLPTAGLAEAHVIWARSPFYGCEFARPISRATVSAALLRAPIDNQPVSLLGPVAQPWDFALPRDPAPRATQAPALASLLALAAAVLALVMPLAMLPTG